MFDDAQFLKTVQYGQSDLKKTPNNDQSLIQIKSPRANTMVSVLELQIVNWIYRIFQGLVAILTKV